MLACVQSRNVVMVLKQVNSLRDRSARSSLRATVWLGPPRTAYGNVRFWRKADIPRVGGERSILGNFSVWPQRN